MAFVQMLLGMGEIQAAQGDSEFSVLGVGSGVVIAAFDRQSGVGGCAHVILPEPPGEYDRDRPGKYAGIGVREMLRKMSELGANESSIRVALVGGAGMIGSGHGGDSVGDLGNRNVMAVLRELEQKGLPCTARDVGGQVGRSLTLCLRSGVVKIRVGQQNEHVLCRLGG